MEQKFGINSLDLQMLREFCEHEGEVVSATKKVSGWSVKANQLTGLAS